MFATHRIRLRWIYLRLISMDMKVNILYMAPMKKSNDDRRAFDDLKY